MDNPWAEADDAANANAPPKEEIQAPPPAPATHALWNGFLDDAQWGSLDLSENFGDGAAYSKQFASTEPIDLPITGPSSIPITPEIFSHIAKESQHEAGHDGWGSPAAEYDSALSLENVVSEASDSVTTVQPDDAPRRSSTELTNAEDDISTRSSTSPSDISRTEAQIESPRTSFEDERASQRPCTDSGIPVENGITISKDEQIFEKVRSPGVPDISRGDNNGGAQTDHGNANISGSRLEDTSLLADDSSASLRQQAGDALKTIEVDLGEDHQVTKPLNISGLDSSLIEKLFPSPSLGKNLTAVSDSPISTTSARKSWYRLTRKQTMREFNSGNDEDNYVRVTWFNSQIRTEVSRIVGRWATEERLSGRGPSAAANFYWDQPVDSSEPLAVNKHLRKKSSMSVSSSAALTKQAAVQPIPVNTTSAQFNWSSSLSTSEDPWQQLSPQSPVFCSTSSPVTETHSAISKVQVSERRSASLDMKGRPSMQSIHSRASSLVAPVSEDSPSGISKDLPTSLERQQDMTKSTQPSISAIPKMSTDTEPCEFCSPSEPISGLPRPNQPEPTISQDGDEEEEDWGEMVQSPTTPFPLTPVKAAPTSTTAAMAQSTLASTPAPVKSSPSDIVRLKGTVSPTSARFKFNSFLPPTTEVETIGRSILKPTKQTNVASEQARSETALQLKDEQTLQEEMTGQEAAAESEPSGGFSASEGSSPVPEAQPAPPVVGTTGTIDHATMSVPAPSNLLAADALFDADFSVFETHTPTTTSPPQLLPTSQHESLDPFFIFETAAPAPSPFTREPSRSATPPPRLPLTGASNSAQRRKSEEDEMVRHIVQGLPDLSYMFMR